LRIERRGRLAPGWAIVLAAAAAACGNPGAKPTSFAEAIAAERAAKDTRFRESSDSPVPVDRRAELLPLQYFDPDPVWSVPASLRPADPSMQPVVEMPTSTGERRRMRRVGVLAFTLQGQSLTLSAFVEADARTTDRLFVPFTDETSGRETYAPGRYLDLDRTPTGLYQIDFNRAYNPYCAYNSAYDCPYPPRENHLPLPVRAGERLPAAGPR
jgi:uncharacterized protein (DUF1684 family)